MSIFLNSLGNSSSTAAEGLHVKHRKWEPESVQGQLDGCDRNLRPKAAAGKGVHAWQQKSFFLVELLNMNNSGKLTSALNELF